MGTHKKIGTILVALMLTVSALALVGCGGDKQAAGDAGGDGSYSLVTPGKLTVGSDCDYPPFIMLNADGQPEGFEHDLSLAIAEEMGLELTYLPPQNFDTIIPQIVSNGKMDVGISSFTITPERAKAIDFSKPYFADGVNQAISVPVQSTITKRDELGGKKIGVQAGTTGGMWAEENLPGAEIVPFTNITDAFNAMMAGKVDACVNDLPAAEALIGKSFKDIKILESVSTAEEYAVVVSKDNPKLKEAVNKAIEKIKSSGKMDEITKKWIEQK